MINENWIDVKGYEGLYQVSNLGNVKSLNRLVIQKNGKETFLKGKPLKQQLDSRGYFRVSLSRNGIARPKCIHHIVLESFCSSKPFPKAEARHLDGNPINNKFDNLKWGTKSENMQDAIKHGTFPLLEKRPGAKLKREQVVEIFTSVDCPYTLSKKYKVGKGVIRQIKTRETWREITKDLPPAKWDYRLKHSQEIINIVLNRSYSRKKICQITNLSIYQVKRIRKMHR